jgi:SdpI/YfhL protein family
MEAIGIPPNRFFGLRIPATIRNESVWYDANALFGRHLVLLGLTMVALEFVPPWVRLTPVLGPIGWGGFFSIFAADWRRANRWRRGREAPR